MKLKLRDHKDFMGVMRWFVITLALLFSTNSYSDGLVVFNLSSKNTKVFHEGRLLGSGGKFAADVPSGKQTFRFQCKSTHFDKEYNVDENNVLDIAFDCAEEVAASGSLRAICDSNISKKGHRCAVKVVAQSRFDEQSVSLVLRNVTTQKVLERLTLFYIENRESHNFDHVDTIIPHIEKVEKWIKLAKENDVELDKKSGVVSKCIDDGWIYTDYKRKKVYREWDCHVRGLYKQDKKNGGYKGWMNVWVGPSDRGGIRTSFSIRVHHEDVRKLIEQIKLKRIEAKNNYSDYVQKQKKKKDLFQ